MSASGYISSTVTDDGPGRFRGVIVLDDGVERVEVNKRFPAREEARDWVRDVHNRVSQSGRGRSVLAALIVALVEIVPIEEAPNA